MISHGLGEYTMASVHPTDTSEEIYANLELRALHRDDRLRYVVNGHSHQPDVRTFDHLTVINAGSLDEARKACFVMVDFEKGVIDYYRVQKSSRVEYCSTVRRSDRADRGGSGPQSVQLSEPSAEPVDRAGRARLPLDSPAAEHQLRQTTGGLRRRRKGTGSPED